MYPQPQLNHLAAQKAALRWNIAVRRTQCAEAAARVVKPVQWLDRMLALWRRLPPLPLFAAMPLGFLVTRAIFPRQKILGAIVRWSPLVFGAVRGIRSLVNPPRRDA
jgi:hypothetical protein